MHLIKITLLLLNFTYFSNLSACDKTCQHGKVWASRYVTYAFTTKQYYESGISSPSNILPLGTKLQGISTVEAQQLTKKAISVWNKFSTLKLIEAKDASKAQIRIGETDLSGKRAGHGYFPGNKAVNGDIHMDNSQRVWTKEIFYRVMLHEMGHALGLAHNADSQSIMYCKINNNSKICLLDIAHIQSLYGPPSAQVNSNPKPNQQEILYYQAKVTSQLTTEREEVSVEILSAHKLSSPTIDTISLQKSNVCKTFFKATGQWTKSLQANAKANKNHCMRINSGAFIATKESIWSINRSYIFHGTESVKYLVSTDDGISFQTLIQETGTSKRREYRTMASNLRSTLNISLDKYKGQKIIVAIEYVNKGLFWKTHGNGLHIKGLTINNIFTFTPQKKNVFTQWATK